MGVVTFNLDNTSPVPAPRLFKALVLDADNLFPKILPQAIKNVEKIEGDGGPGSIKKLISAEGSPFKYVKRRVDALDKDSLTYAYTMVESDAFTNKIDSVTCDLKLEPASDGGCIVKLVSKYHTKPGAEINEEIETGKKMNQDILKAVEAHLLANPDAYV